MKVIFFRLYTMLVKLGYVEKECFVIIAGGTPVMNDGEKNQESKLNKIKIPLEFYMKIWKLSYK